MRTDEFDIQSCKSKVYYSAAVIPGISRKHVSRQLIQRDLFRRSKSLIVVHAACRRYKILLRFLGASEQLFMFSSYSTHR